MTAVAAGEALAPRLEAVPHGVAQYIDGYPGGLPGFVERARILAKAYGDRFALPASLVEKAEKGQSLRAE